MQKLSAVMKTKITQFSRDMHLSRRNVRHLSDFGIAPELSFVHTLLLHRQRYGRSSTSSKVTRWKFILRANI